MRNISSIVPNGHCFNLGDRPFVIESSDLQKIIALGPVLGRFMNAMQAIVQTVTNTNIKLTSPWKLVRDILSVELNAQHKKLLGVHPQRNSLLTRVDFMIDETGELKIAEIDPMNKHGLGFALLCRNESGHSARQRILSLFSELLSEYEDLFIILSRKDEFFEKEQCYFAEQLSGFAGKSVDILTESDQAGIIKSAQSTHSCFLDCPVLQDGSLNQRLLDVFLKTPKRFLMPPKHWMGNKALMAFLHEPLLLEILNAFLSDMDIGLLKQYIPPTFATNPCSDGFVVKKVLSSGAKGVFFGEGAPKGNVVYQKYVLQKKFILEGKDQHIRIAVHYVGVQLGELTVTSSADLPVHGNSQSVNYHVVLKT